MFDRQRMTLMIAGIVMFVSELIVFAAGAAALLAAATYAL
jgi:hypothetical protein